MNPTRFCYRVIAFPGAWTTGGGFKFPLKPNSVASRPLGIWARGKAEFETSEQMNQQRQESFPFDFAIALGDKPLRRSCIFRL